MLSAGQEAPGEIAHAVQPGEIQRFDLDPGDVASLRAGGLGVARRDDDARAGLGQRAGGFQSQAGVAAGDDGGGVGQVQAGEHRLRVAAPKPEPIGNCGWGMANPCKPWDVRMESMHCILRTGLETVNAAKSATLSRSSEAAPWIRCPKS